jgi:hypothetical protein
LSFSVFADETSDTVVSEQCPAAAVADQGRNPDPAEAEAAAEPGEPDAPAEKEVVQAEKNETMTDTPVSSCTREEKKEEVAEKTPEVEEPEALPPPPPPPKRTSQTNQRLKRWSKMLKHTLPNKLPKVTAAAHHSDKDAKAGSMTSKDRKSLKDKVMEGELAVFLKERRAVSESRFRILDKLTASGGPRPPLPRTKSNDVIKKPMPTGGRYIGKTRRTSGSKNRNWGNEIQPGTLSNLKEIFESKSASCSPTRSELRSPSLLKEMLASQEKLNESGRRDFSPASKSNGRPSRLSSEERQADIKRMQVTVTVHPAVQSLVDDDKDTSTTSPESGQVQMLRITFSRAVGVGLRNFLSLFHPCESG